MKLFCTLALVATASALVETRLDSSMLDSLSGDAKFGAYKTMFGKSYGSVADESAAKTAFFANDAIIATHNAKGLSYWLGHNEFSDLTWEQFKAQYVGRFEDNPHANRTKNYQTLPAATDDTQERSLYQDVLWRFLLGWTDPDVVLINRQTEFLALIPSLLRDAHRGPERGSVDIDARDCSCQLAGERLQAAWDKHYGPHWNCIVGRSFGSYVTHEIKTYIYFSVKAHVAVLLWKT